MSQQSAPAIWTTEALRLSVEAAGITLWSWNIATDELSLDQAARDLWGVPDQDPEVSFENLSAHIHPAEGQTAMLPKPSPINKISDMTVSKSVLSCGN